VWSGEKPGLPATLLSENEGEKVYVRYAVASLLSLMKRAVVSALQIRSPRREKELIISQLIMCIYDSLSF